jgi:hypothetical protein
MKNKYNKLTFFKVYKYDCKSDEKSVVVSEVFFQLFLALKCRIYVF